MSTYIQVFTRFQVYYWFITQVKLVGPGRGEGVRFESAESG